jgi:hypothetical protein
VFLFFREEKDPEEASSSSVNKPAEENSQESSSTAEPSTSTGKTKITITTGKFCLRHFYFTA